jgi:hypothetical protein
VRGENTCALFEGSHSLILQHRGSLAPLIPQPLLRKGEGESRALQHTCLCQNKTRFARWADEDVRDPTHHGSRHYNALRA